MGLSSQPAEEAANGDNAGVISSTLPPLMQSSEQRLGEIKRVSSAGVEETVFGTPDPDDGGILDDARVRIESIKASLLLRASELEKEEAARRAANTHVKVKTRRIWDDATKELCWETRCGAAGTGIGFVCRFGRVHSLAGARRLLRRRDCDRLRLSRLHSCLETTGRTPCFTLVVANTCSLSKLYQPNHFGCFPEASTQNRVSIAAR